MGGKCVNVLSIFILSNIIIVAMGLVIPGNRDKMYLPDQIDYLRAWSAICDTDNLIFWPKDGQCYPELSRGPCFVQEVLLLDRQSLVPRCAPEPPESIEPTSDPTLATAAPAVSLVK